MYIALVIVHILVAFVMVGVILLQSGKGAEIGAALGVSDKGQQGLQGRQGHNRERRVLEVPESLLSLASSFRRATRHR